MSEVLSEVGFEVEYLPIKVSEKILLHIGTGIYSSVAGAIKELVNNAFDADAQQVIISTGFPNFEEIRIFDNGHGMSLERFKMAIASIGNSMKATIDQRRITKKHKRPIIGHLGIGLMALSQLCEKAIIESQEKGANTKFSALIDFTHLRPNSLEKRSLSVLSDHYGGTELLRRQLEKEEAHRREEIRLHLKLALEADRARERKGFELEEEHLGYCMFMEEQAAHPYTQGTMITLLGIRPEIKRALTGEERVIDSLVQNDIHEEFDWKEYLSQINKWSWRELCERVRAETNGFTYQALPSYHHFLYELALLSPVPYLDDGPISIRPEILLEKKKELKSFKFSVRVDNRLLYKPILLPSGALAKQKALEEGYDYLITPLRFDDEVDGSQLNYHGYLYWQKSQNKPSAIRGIQLYIRHVGIGLYDQTLLNFSKMHPTNRVGQISGEIYVEKGLERALNVDRSSFRQTDAHYVALQQHIWKELGSACRHEGILGKAMQADEQRKKAELEQHIATLEKLLSSATNGKVDLSITANKAAQPIQVNNRKLVFNLESNRWPATTTERLLGQKILLAMSAAAARGASAQDALAVVEGILLK